MDDRAADEKPIRGWPIGSLGAPSTLDVADFDGDGALDLATVSDSQFPDFVTVRLNVGGGMFGDAAAYPIVARPRSMAAADIDGNGTQDLVTAGIETDVASVLLARADGGFDPLVSYPGGAAPIKVLIDDANGDDHLDLVLVNQNDFTSYEVFLSFLPGNGDGTFGPEVRSGSYEVGLGGAMGDFDNDGDPDVVVLDSIGVQLFHNDGQGVFANGATIDTGNRSDVIASDIDGDVDIVTLDGFAGMVCVHLNDGTGAFTLGGTYGSGHRSFRMTSGDFDGNGSLDLATSELLGAVTVHMNDGQGGFPNRVEIDAPRAFYVDAGDIDGDLDLDLIVAKDFHNPGNDVLTFLNVCGEPPQ